MIVAWDLTYMILLESPLLTRTRAPTNSRRCKLVPKHQYQEENRHYPLKHPETDPGPPGKNSPFGNVLTIKWFLKGCNRFSELNHRLNGFFIVLEPTSEFLPASRRGRCFSHYLAACLFYFPPCYGTRVMSGTNYMQCERVSSIEIDDDSQDRSSELELVYIPDSCFESCFDKQGSALFLIGKSAFSGCSSLKSICLPGRLKRLNRLCFAGCSSHCQFPVESGSAPLYEIETLHLSSSVSAWIY
jgi:hypothetical protein